MGKTKQLFEIIRFTADSRVYFPTSTKNDYMTPESIRNQIQSGIQIVKEMGIYSDSELEEFKKQFSTIDLEFKPPEHHVPYTAIEIPLGQSRYGGPVVDLPSGIEYPKDLRFAAQLDLSKFSPFDKSGLLPKTGQLIFFADIMNDKGKVIYTDVSNDKLVRVINEHEDNFFSGVLIDKIFADTETLEERFREAEDEYEEEVANEDGKVWDDFAGSGKSKIFGIYTHCQYGQEEIEKITFSDKLLLLQVGENGFNDEGVFSVLISRQDLINKNFDNCAFAWGQS